MPAEQLPPPIDKTETLSPDLRDEILSRQGLMGPALVQLYQHRDRILRIMKTPTDFRSLRWRVVVGEGIDDSNLVTQLRQPTFYDPSSDRPAEVTSRLRSNQPFMPNRTVFDVVNTTMMFYIEQRGPVAPVVFSPEHRIIHAEPYGSREISRQSRGRMIVMPADIWDTAYERDTDNQPGVYALWKRQQRLPPASAIDQHVLLELIAGAEKQLAPKENPITATHRCLLHIFKARMQSNHDKPFIKILNPGTGLRPNRMSIAVERLPTATRQDIDTQLLQLAVTNDQHNQPLRYSAAYSPQTMEDYQRSMQTIKDIVAVSGQLKPAIGTFVTNASRLAATEPGTISFIPFPEWEGYMIMIHQD